MGRVRSRTSSVPLHQSSPSLHRNRIGFSPANKKPHEHFPRLAASPDTVLKHRLSGAKRLDLPAAWRAFATVYRGPPSQLARIRGHAPTCQSMAADDPFFNLQSRWPISPSGADHVTSPSAAVLPGACPGSTVWTTLEKLKRGVSRVFYNLQVWCSRMCCGPFFR